MESCPPLYRRAGCEPVPRGPTCHLSARDAGAAGTPTRRVHTHWEHADTALRRRRPHDLDVACAPGPCPAAHARGAASTGPSTLSTLAPRFFPIVFSILVETSAVGVRPERKASNPVCCREEPAATALRRWRPHDLDVARAPGPCRAAHAERPRRDPRRSRRGRPDVSFVCTWPRACWH